MAIQARPWLRGQIHGNPVDQEFTYSEKEAGHRFLTDSTRLAVRV